MQVLVEIPKVIFNLTCADNTCKTYNPSTTLGHNCPFACPIAFARQQQKPLWYSKRNFSLTNSQPCPNTQYMKVMYSSKLLSTRKFPFDVLRLNEQCALGRFVPGHGIELPANTQINSSFEVSNTKLTQVPSNNRSRQKTSSHRLDSTLRKFQKVVPNVPARCCY